MQQQTSLQAYINIQPQLGHRQQEVIDALRKMGEATNRMLAAFMIRDINCITPRIFELRQKGMVIESRRGICSITRNTAIFWRVR